MTLSADDKFQDYVRDELRDVYHQPTTDVAILGEDMPTELMSATPRHSGHGMCGAMELHGHHEWADENCSRQVDDVEGMRFGMGLVCAALAIGITLVLAVGAGVLLAIGALNR